MTIMAQAEAQAGQPVTLDALNTDRQVAAYLKTSVPTMRRWRAEGVGPKWIRIGKSSIRYTRESVLDFIAEAG